MCLTTINNYQGGTLVRVLVVKPPETPYIWQVLRHKIDLAWIQVDFLHCRPKSVFEQNQQEKLQDTSTNQALVN